MRAVVAEGSAGDLGCSRPVETGQRGGFGKDELVGLRVVELRQLPLVETIPFLYAARVALREVILVILHFVAVDGPHLILVVLKDLEPVELLLDDFRGILEEDLRVGDVQFILFCLTLDPFHLAELLKEGI